MTEPDISVSIEDIEFTVGELQQFLDTIRAVDGMPVNALIKVDYDPPAHRLTACTGYRAKS